MGGCVRVIKGEEFRRDDPAEYFFPSGVGNASGFPEGVMAIEVPQNEGRKGIGSAIRRGGANKGGRTH